MSGPYDHAYGRFFYQYHKNNFGIQYDSLYSDVNNKREYIDAEEKRREKIQEAKDNDINRINEHYFDSRFLHVSNCGDILE